MRAPDYKEYDHLRGTRHWRLARERLESLAAHFARSGVAVLWDNFPFHCLVPLKDSTSVSIYHSGYDFKDFYEVQKLTKEGEPDHHCEEEGFDSPAEVLTYIVDRFQVEWSK